LFWAVAMTIRGTELGAAGKYCDSSMTVIWVPGDDNAMILILFLKCCDSIHYTYLSKK